MELHLRFLGELLQKILTLVSTSFLYADDTPTYVLTKGCFIEKIESNVVIAKTQMEEQTNTWDKQHDVYLAW
jgi:hypothetical protein